MPGCCAAMVLSNFVGTEETIRAEIKDAKLVWGKMKVLLATTSDGEVGKVQFGEAHRQNQKNQLAAQNALEAEGFKKTRPLFNTAHHHTNTGVRVWWWNKEACE
jgi:hypothetical protein